MLLAIASSAMGQQSNMAAQDELVHLNQIQVIGSHNSYHAGFAPSERKYLEMKNPKALRGLDYHHAPLGEQLSGGMRQIEIDVFADPDGGRFAHPAVVRNVAAAGLPVDPDFDPQHPKHIPIFILVETKEDTPRAMPNAVKAEPFTSALFDALDAEIRSVFRPNEIITPDEVRGNASTLVEAVHSGKWPTLAKARGRVIFLMDQQHVGPIYTEGHPSLKGRILFTNAIPGAPDAAFIEQNEGSLDEINSLVKEGYLVRTRTDEGTEQARTNDRTRRDLALSSGAQMLSTDYPLSEPSSWTKYSVGLPHGLVARCNPVNKPAGCVDSLLEAAPDVH
jgi:hypothetical protein